MTQGCSAWLKGAVHDGAPVLVHRRRASAGAVQHTRGAALVGFLSGYSGLTLDAYRLDLRQFVAWCTERDVRLFGARRVDIEQFGRHLEGLGRARATVARRLGTIVCFYRYAEQEGLIERSPAVHVRRPRLDYESHATGLDRNEVGSLLVAAGLSGARDHALLSLLALNGLRVSEATGADVDRLGLERGRRALTVLRKGGKTVLIPLAPRTARAVDLAVGERSDGPIFLGRRRPARSSRRRPDRAPPGSQRRDREASRSPHPPPRVHHRSARRRRTPSRRPRGTKPCRPAHHDALRPWPRLP